MFNFNLLDAVLYLNIIFQTNNLTFVCDYILSFVYTILFQTLDTHSGAFKILLVIFFFKLTIALMLS